MKLKELIKITCPIDRNGTIYVNAFMHNERDELYLKTISKFFSNGVEWIESNEYTPLPESLWNREAKRIICVPYEKTLLFIRFI